MPNSLKNNLYLNNVKEKLKPLLFIAFVMNTTGQLK
jgi:hypothetical protein